MESVTRGLILIIVLAIIGWYFWFRSDEGREEIDDIYEAYKAAVRSSHRLLPKKYQAQFSQRLLPPKNKDEFKKWWKSLSDEERDEVIKAIHNPLGNKEEY